MYLTLINSPVRPTGPILPGTPGHPELPVAPVDPRGPPGPVAPVDPYIRHYHTQCVLIYYHLPSSPLLQYSFSLENLSLFRIKFLGNN